MVKKSDKSKDKKKKKGQQDENDEDADEEPKIGDCNLECKQKGFRLQKLKQLTGDVKLPKFQLEGGKEAHEFIGPVRVVLVSTPKGEYAHKIWGASTILFSFFAIGVTIMPMIFYSTSFTEDKNLGLHVLLFTAAMLIPIAFLVMNLNNGSSSILKPKHRKVDYLVLKVTAFICIIIGIKCLLSSKAMKSGKQLWALKNITSHGASGVVAVFLFIIDICTMPVIPCNSKRIWPKLALVLCIPTLLTSTVCFILSLFRPNFVKWLPLSLIRYVIIVCSLFYNIICIMNPINNFQSG